MIFGLQNLLWGLSSLRLGLGFDVGQKLGMPSEYLIVKVLNELIVPHQVQVEDDLLIEPPIEEVKVLAASRVFLHGQKRAVH